MLASAIAKSANAPAKAAPGRQPGPNLNAAQQALKQRPRATQALYRAIAAGLEPGTVVWDVGCGDGQGTALLTGDRRRVVGIDCNPDSLALAKSWTSNIEFVPTLPLVAELTPDIVLVADVLGYCRDPETLLLHISQLAKATTTIIVAEPRAEVSQQLLAPKRRAFSALDVEDLMWRAGWQNVNAHEFAHNYSLLSATAANPSMSDALATLSQGNDWAEGERLLTPWFEHIAPQAKARVQVRLAEAAASAGNGDQASSFYMDALRTVPELNSALSGLARLTLTCGNPLDALNLAARCLEADPTHIPALRVWVEIASHSDDRVELQRLCQALAYLTPGDASVQAALAQLHAESGDADLAIQDLERLRIYWPAPSVDLSVTLAWLLDSVGRRADAQVEARVAATLAPDSPEVADLLTALGALDVGRASGSLTTD